MEKLNTLAKNCILTSCFSWFFLQAESVYGGLQLSCYPEHSLQPESLVCFQTRYLLTKFLAVCREALALFFGWNIWTARWMQDQRWKQSKAGIYTSTLPQNVFLNFQTDIRLQTNQITQLQLRANSLIWPRNQHLHIMTAPKNCTHSGLATSLEILLRFSCAKEQ